MTKHIYLGLLPFFLLMACDEVNTDIGGGLQLINGDQIEKVEGLIGDTLVVLLYNPGKATVKTIDFDMNDLIGEERQTIYYASQYNIPAGDTIRFVYPIPTDTPPTDSNNTYLRIDVNVHYKDVFGHFIILPVFISE